MKQPPTYTPKEAEKLGYQSITISYSDTSKIDQEHLANVLRDMVGVEHCIIETGRGKEVARLKIELL